jgi:hypothetical protein
MRYSVVLAILLSLVVLPSQGWAKPPILVDHISSQCINGVPTITVTLNPVTWNSWNGYLYYHLNPPSAGVAWSPNTNPATFNVPATPNPGNLQITSAPAPTGGTPSAVYPYTVATCSGAKKGMTWSHSLSNAQTGTITVGCGPTGTNQCDPHQGDTLCTQLRPLLCIYKPTTPFPLPVGMSNADQYNLWSGGVVATTQPIAGSTFSHISASPGTDANSYCEAQFGPGWRVAEFHDGWGWHFQAYGGTVSAPTVPSTRFWVHVNDQPAANCWATP